jgi:GNAT superfamily N-acetyltransferase
MTLIVQYGPRFEKAHYEFASRHWKKRKRTTAEYIYWKFRGKPKEKLNSFLLAIDNEQVVGQLGVIPCTLLLGEKKIEAQWACELMVDTAFRGKGIAKLLYDFAFTLKPVTLGSDPSHAAAVSMKRAGFISVRGPVKFLFPMYVGEITKLKGINSALLDKVPNPFILVLRLWNLIKGNNRFRGIDAAEYLEGLRESSSEPDKWIRVDHENGFADWRFNTFKDYYNGIELYSNESGSLFSLYRHPDTYIVTEYLPRKLSSLSDILGAVISDARKNRTRKIKLLAHSPSEIRLLSFLGFVRFRTRSEIIFHCADPDLEEVMMSKPFYYTYLDSDENI